MLFAGAGGKHAVIEATTGYLVSNVAVPNIPECQPKARFVVCLRDLVALFFSLHVQQPVRDCHAHPRRHLSGARRTPDPTLRARLIDHFAEEVTLLAKMIRRDLSHWSHPSTERSMVGSRGAGSRTRSVDVQRR